MQPISLPKLFLLYPLLLIFHTNLVDSQGQGNTFLQKFINFQREVRRRKLDFNFKPCLILVKLLLI